MTRTVAIYGASGFGREVLPVVRRQVPPGTRLVFIDDSAAGTELIGHAVIDWADFLAMPTNVRSVTVAIADWRVRERLMQRCAEEGVAQFEVRGDNVIVGDAVEVGEGAILQPFTMLTASIVIGRGFHANIYSYVAHDCRIGDFVTFAPGVKCNGNVHIHNYAYIGTGAVLRQGSPNKPLVIGAGAVVGMGAVVTKDVAPGTTVVGNPAKPLIKG